MNIKPLHTDPLTRLMNHAASLAFLAASLPEEQGGLAAILDLMAQDVQLQCEVLDTAEIQGASHATT